VITVAIDVDSPVPVYEQLRSQIATAIRTGVLHGGQALPTIRQLAADLSLAPNTVARAYRELERTGLLRTGGRRGTVVADVTGVPGVERRQRLVAAADRYAAEVLQLGASLEEAVDALRTSDALRRRRT
jgi:DNA-binding transcriptional regulator YhcF (GntR family)